MANTIREALERLLAVIKPKYTDPDEIVAVVRAMVAARAALAAEPPAPADPSDFQTLQGIALDMVESLRPIVLPEILGVLRRAIKQSPAPAPEAGEAEELAQWLKFEADNAQELGCATIYDHDRLRWAAGYLRQLPPEGLSAEEYYHIDSGARIVRETCDEGPGGCWTVRNSRHVSPCTEFRTVADAVAALQQARRQEVGDA